RRDVRRRVLGEMRARAWTSADSREVRQRTERRRKRPLGSVVEAAVLELEPAAADADLRALVHERHEPLESVVEQARIRIQDEDVGARAAADGQVVRLRETKVLRGCNELDFRELLGHHPRRSVRRGVVHDEDPRWWSTTVGADARQAVPQVIPALVGDDYD